MKKFLVTSLIILITGNIYSQSGQGVFPGLPVGELSDIFKADSDFQQIVSINTELLRRFANSNEDPNTIDLSNHDVFLHIVNLSESEYLALHEIVRNCGLRLIERYQIDINDGCESCQLSENELTKRIAGIIDKLQHHPEIEYDILKSALGDSQQVGNGPCCKATFYVCCAICAATIEAFPVYLACCSLCACSYCCDAACIYTNSSGQ